MTGIVIITASREDAYQDYQQSVKQGHDPTTLTEYLDDATLNTVTDEDTGRVHCWGTGSEGVWRSVAPNDIVLVYRESWRS